MPNIRTSSTLHPRIQDSPRSRNILREAPGAATISKTRRLNKPPNLKKTLPANHRKNPLLYCNPIQSRRNAGVDINNIKSSAIGFTIRRIFSRPDGPGRCITIETGRLAARQYRWHTVRPAPQSESRRQHRQAGWGIDSPAAEHRPTRTAREARLRHRKLGGGPPRQLRQRRHRRARGRPADCRPTGAPGFAKHRGVWELHQRLPARREHRRGRSRCANPADQQGGKIHARWRGPGTGRLRPTEPLAAAIGQEPRTRPDRERDYRRRTFRFVQLQSERIPECTLRCAERPPGHDGGRHRPGRTARQRPHPDPEGTARLQRRWGRRPRHGGDHP